ncbi:MAG: hypothetical protein LLG02_12410 [Pelosinus sp.]|nr:hypothetical protein [Pelosinus sp.]
MKQVSCKTASCCTKPEALSLLLLENLTSTTINRLPAETQCQGPLPTKLHQLVAGICLRNPFWNDFRLLSFFAKRNMKLSLKDLQQLKMNCNVESKISVCHTLMEMYFTNPKQLSPQQIGFIERINPPFCDRNITSSAPGKLLLYECIFIRRLSRKIKGMLYLHIFIDIYNGYVFGQFSQEHSIKVGVSLLEKELFPFYAKESSVITTLLSSKQGIQDAKDLSLYRKKLPPGCKWKETSHQLGTIQGFLKFELHDFFEGLRLYNSSYAALDAPFARWLRSRNAAHPFEDPYSFMECFDLTNCAQLSLD